mmetsp:Transcript_136866/g.425176  ORF Transcript_136866/g.425176 Transcript_136866/m.425176 type:complete len:203 (-) Transcript_136866:129-737(-)
MTTSTSAAWTSGPTSTGSAPKWTTTEKSIERSSGRATAARGFALRGQAGAAATVIAPARIELLGVVGGPVLAAGPACVCACVHVCVRVPACLSASASSVRLSVCPSVCRPSVRQSVSQSISRRYPFREGMHPARSGNTHRSGIAASMLLGLRAPEVQGALVHLLQELARGEKSHHHCTRPPDVQSHVEGRHGLLPTGLCCLI